MILNAARTLFERYGYRKTSMQDIAQAAGISRPTLYAAFADKEAVFSALVRSVTEQNEAATALVLARTSGIRDRLRAVLDIWIVERYAATFAASGSSDIVESAAISAPEAMGVFWDVCSRRVSEVLEDIAEERYRSAVVRVLVAAARDFKATAQSVADLSVSIDTLVDVADQITRQVRGAHA